MELGIHFIDFLPGDARALTPDLLSTATENTLKSPIEIGRRRCTAPCPI